MNSAIKELKLDRDYVTYEDFGAVGDGKSEDFGAIYKTHEYANEHGLTVKATAGRTYYIKDTKLGTDEVHVAKIKTNVDWCGAHFIIDNTNLTVMKDYPEERKIAMQWIFLVVPEKEHEMFTIEDPVALERIAKAGINQKTKKIDIGVDWDGPMMIVPYTSAHKAFKRRGTTQFDGSDMHEIILLDKAGNVSPETPIMFSYATVDKLEVYKLDPSCALTVENGVFTTLESRVNHYIPKADGTRAYIYHGYINRGIKVLRSYTTVKNIEHIVTGGFTLLDRVERNLEGAMYHGFISVADANHVTLKDCILPGRTSPGPGGGHSSYGFNAQSVNKIVLDGCIQPNFWVTIDPETYEIKNATVYDKNAVGCAVKGAKDVYEGMSTVTVNGVSRKLCWGFGGTHYCKNMEYINSTLTRFDAHSGLYNGKIINCNVTGIMLTGYGDMLVEGSNWYQYGMTAPMIYLRGDYGFHWRGDVNVKNTNVHLMNTEKFYLVNHNFVNWYYGYTTSFPNITVDNLRFFDSSSGEPVKPGFELRFFNFTASSARMHLDDAKVPSIFGVVDKDGDGYIDEPRFISDVDGSFYPERDLDGDGRVGNTSLKYDDYVNGSVFISGGLARSSYYKGATHPTCTANLNKIRPPKYFKVLNNRTEGGEIIAKYIFKDTSGEDISDGGWHRDADAPDTMGGFFGGTEFIYGDDAGERFVGTKNKNAVCDSIAFDKEYDKE